MRGLVKESKCRTRPKKNLSYVDWSFLHPVTGICLVCGINSLKHGDMVSRWSGAPWNFPENTIPKERESCFFTLLNFMSGLTWYPTNLKWKVFNGGYFNFHHSILFFTIMVANWNWEIISFPHHYQGGTLRNDDFSFPWVTPGLIASYQVSVPQQQHTASQHQTINLPRI